MNLHKVLKIVAFALAIIGAIFALMIIGSDEDAAKGLSGNILYVAYAVLAIVIALVLVFVIKGLFSGDIKKTLLTVGAFLVIIAISFGVSSGSDLDLQPFIQKGSDVTESTSKTVGAGLIAFYILAVLAIGSMLVGGAKKILNK
ncbi:hypothetical protein [Neotamlana laminarinivorans]|uniref:Uncharacterized protein n=1 Tax=Neotamlana laminarinivorans TaxID=2883124 RepID=A0A9X1I115_9FLAO|nr:hypothetical protein [Tamlana laminarinivorans]MCB4799834.1 hypothetical protein [Tamlana laminarinivorans]